MYKKIVIGTFIALAFIIGSKSALAATPSLTLSATGSGDSVQINVSGDANSGVAIYYTNNSGLQVSALGTTNSSGQYSTTVSTGTYGVLANSSVYVVVDGQKSNTVAWPNVTSTSGTLSLSQTSAVLSVGQSTTISAYNSGSNTLFLSNNSNPSIANVSISGSSFTITANAYGSTVVTVCAVGTSSNCSSVYVTVQNSSAQALNFSQNNITVATGQNLSIAITGGTGNYTILNNSNPSTIQSTISGSTVNLYANTTSGTSAITVCSTDMSSCGIITATAGAVSSSNVSFSQTNPTVSIGQSLPITLNGGNGTYYVSSNSNSGVVSSSLSNNTLTLFGISNGTANLVVCSSSSGCGTLIVTVNGSTSGGTISLSQTSLALLTGQTLSVTISGGTAPYSVLSNSGSIFQTSINGNILTLTGIASGSNTITVCSAAGGCTSLAVTVTNNGTTSTSGQPILSPSSLSLTQGQSSNVSISGNGSYYVSSNTNTNIASVTLNGSTLTVYALNSGTTSATICQVNGSCTVLYISVGSTTTTPTTTTGSFTVSQVLSVGQNINLSVSGGSAPYSISGGSGIVGSSLSGNILTLGGVTAGTTSLNVCSSNGSCLPISIIVLNTGTTVTPTTTTSGKYIFSNPLTLGSTGPDVTALQQRLTAEGDYDGPITGYYGSLTMAAVQKYQSDHGLSTLGNVGPATRAALNQ